MRLVSSLFPAIIEVTDAAVFSLVIENKALYLKVLKDLYGQTTGEDGEIILSENDEVLRIADHIEMITDFVSFTANRKKLLGRLNHALEDAAQQGKSYADGMELLAQIGRYMGHLAETFPFSLDFVGLTLPTLIKMASPKFVDDSDTELDRILYYMELVRELMGDRLYIMAGMKTCFSDLDMQDFIDTVVLHKYKVLLLESRESAILNNEQRLLIDNDICVI